MEKIHLIGITGNYVYNSDTLGTDIASRIIAYYKGEGKRIRVVRVGFYDKVQSTFEHLFHFFADKTIKSIYSDEYKVFSKEKLNKEVCSKSIEYWIRHIKSSLSVSNQDFWIKYVDKEVSYENLLSISSNVDTIIIIPDVELPKEADYIKENNGFLFGLVESLDSTDIQCDYVAQCDGTDNISVVADDIFEYYIKPKLHEE